MIAFITQVAQSIFFDNTGTGFTSTDVQNALVEARNQSLVEAQYAQNTGTATTTSTAFISLGVDITPPAGTYIAVLSLQGAVAVSGVNNRAEIGIFVGGTLEAESLREFGIGASGISLASFGVSHALGAVCQITVNGSQIVQGGIRRVTGSTVSYGPSTLTLLRRNTP